MTPQERELLTNLVNRLRQSPQQDLDQEAESMINDLVSEKPETSYILAQTVLIQDYALHQAQARIAELEKKAQEGKHEGGFLSAIFGGNKPAQPDPRPQPSYQPQPSYAPQPQPAAGPWGPAPQPAPQYFVQPVGQPSFLRSAATTAAGIAGGALLFQGIESLFGGHPGFGYGGFGGAGFGGFAPQPGITETVINNYNDDPAHGETHADFDHDRGGVDNANFDQGGNFDQSNDFTDASFGDNSDFGGGGGDDFV